MWQYDSQMTSAGAEEVRVARGTWKTQQKVLATCEGACNIQWGWFFADDVNWRKTIPTVMMATGLEQPLWCVRCMEEFFQNFDRHVAWMVGDDSDGIL